MEGARIGFQVTGDRTIDDEVELLDDRDPFLPFGAVKRIHVVGQHADRAPQSAVASDQLGHLRADEVVAGGLVEVTHQPLDVEAVRVGPDGPVVAFGDLAVLPPHVLVVGSVVERPAPRQRPKRLLGLADELEGGQQDGTTEVEQQVFERGRGSHAVESINTRSCRQPRRSRLRNADIRSRHGDGDERQLRALLRGLRGSRRSYVAARQRAR